LSLLNNADRDKVMQWCSNQAKDIFIREVPRISSLIDHYAESLNIARRYDNFTQSSLFAFLEKFGFDILNFEREYDMYIHAVINKDTT